MTLDSADETHWVGHVTSSLWSTGGAQIGAFSFYFNIWICLNTFNWWECIFTLLFIKVDLLHYERLFYLFPMWMRYTQIFLETQERYKVYGGVLLFICSGCHSWWSRKLIMNSMAVWEIASWGYYKLCCDFLWVKGVIKIICLVKRRSTITSWCHIFLSFVFICTIFGLFTWTFKLCIYSIYFWYLFRTHCFDVTLMTHWGGFTRGK